MEPIWDSDPTVFHEMIEELELCRSLPAPLYAFLEAHKRLHLSPVQYRSINPNCSQQEYAWRWDALRRISRMPYFGMWDVYRELIHRGKR